MTSQRVALALQRLTESRAALHQVLVPAADADKGGLLPRRWRALLRTAWAAAPPWIRQHPVAATAAAAAVGGLLVALRPWRWPLINAGLQTTGQQMFRWVGVLLAQPSTQMALASLLTTLAAQAMHKPPTSAAAPASPSDPAAP